MSGKRVKQIRKIVKKQKKEIGKEIWTMLFSYKLKDRAKIAFKILIGRKKIKNN